MTTPAEPPAPATAGQSIHDQQVDQRLTGIERAIAALGGQYHPAAQAHTEQRLDRPQLVADQVEAALRQADESRKRTEHEAATTTALQTLAADVKKLKETPPGQALRPVTSLMWGKAR